MAAFSYQALDSTGRTVGGTLEADSAKAARSQLRGQGLTPISVQEAAAKPSASSAAASSWRQPRPALTRQELAVWTRQLASLVASGLNIERALGSLGDEADHERVRVLMADLLSQVKAGSSFSQALRGHAAEFDEVYCAVVAAGEGSGSLGLVLTSLADDLEATQQLKAKVVGAALYPAIVSAIAVLIVVFLMVYVLPQVAGAFESSKRSLPLLTVVMLGISAFLKQWWWALALLLLAGLVGLQLGLKQTVFRTRFLAWLLTLPLLGKLLRHYNAARFSGTLGMLVQAGVPILQALKAARHTVGNLAMRRDLEDVTRLVREGAPLGLALGQKSSFPKLVSTFARLGAETGNLGPMLLRVGAQLSAEVQRRALQLASVLEPMLILAMGVVVMMIVLAVLLPIIQLNSFVQ